MLPATTHPRTRYPVNYHLVDRTRDDGVRMDWDDALATGDEAIDAQHRDIIALCNRLSHAEKDGPDEVRRVLDQLMDYVSVHFAMEHDLMLREEYPLTAVDEHLSEHDRMTQETRQYVLEYRQGRLTSVAPILTFLEDWISRHVAEIDGKLAAHVRRRAAGQT
jgi:hemerythrin